MRSRAIIAIAALLSTATQAQAYLDPGTGSLILQSLIGGIAAAWAIIQLNYGRIKNFLKTLRNGKPESNPKNDLEK